jgi:signal transduction histidine kinase
MKGSWVTAFAVGGVLFLLTLFLGLQYNWLAQASEAERERLQRRVEADTKNFADDFNRELQAAFFNFQTDAAGWENKDWTEFNERYDFWRARTQYSDLIKEIVYFAKGDATPVRYDTNTRVFVPAAVGEDLLTVRRLAESDRYTPFYESQYVLVMPIHDAEKRLEGVHLRRTVPDEPPMVRMPERKGLLMIALDRDVISGRILPDLAAKHFPEGNFRVGVRNKGETAVYEPAGALSGADATAGLLGLTPDNMIFFTERGGVWSKMHTEKRQAAVVSEHLESKTFTHSETGPEGTKTGTYTIELKPGPAAGTGVKARTSIFASSNQDGDPWKLSVQHTAGSVDAFARKEFIKSFSIGLGLYILLVGAIIAIVLSALRSKRFAQRQIDFVSSVSHEFRTPLAVIFSAGENLADGVANDREQVTRYGSLIKGEGRKLSAMVEQILQFAGARSGRKKYNFAATDISRVVEAAISECRPILEENGFTVETEVDADLPVVNADADAVATALQNLISNAVKYSNGSRWIKVSASNGGGPIKLSVEDRGIGIAGDDMRLIFEPFYRAGNVVDAQIHGNGLGLALVKQIADAHGGKVRVSSTAGKGSKFTIELPRA